MPNQIQIGPQIATDGGVVNQRGGNFGETMVQQYNGKYAELARRGQLFNFSVAAAAAILLTNTTANGPTIWNPLGSGKILYLCSLRVSFVSGTTTVSSLIWNVTRNAGSAAATGSPILTFTNVAPTPAAIGGASVSSMLWAPVTSTYTAAPGFFAATGINLGAAAPTAGGGNYDQDIDGQIALYPGNALTLNCSVATTTALFWTTIIGAEVPYFA